MNYKLIKRDEIIDVNTINHSLDTERLNILPLQSHQLALALEDYAKMQTDLGLTVINTILDEEMEYAMKVRLKKVLEDANNYLWLTNWAIIHKEENRIIGFIILKGSPNEFGEVIVGYMIEESHQRKGYATEALKALTQWIFNNPQALSVIADTEKTNTPSNKLLESLGAVKYKETDGIIWWKIEK
ncbi:GNAT family N-acetyltransferase [Clostridium folliculivorans]|uniref:N-acetyltransferase n=1 Tax=Clostridium folliculivorans TaxID=2886038 RepID=A0A9W5Y077_9CLOT|nr:GNAT family N-acetyltransferase [Clostridium folliculivorans]GKU24217.1 N-acetyltransferase [Clostridium folliculivorans]GKU30322.1 N-acetyltransferase [Clostridium folliculivorans]